MSNPIADPCAPESTADPSRFHNDDDDDDDGARGGDAGEGFEVDEDGMVEEAVGSARVGVGCVDVDEMMC